MANASRGGHKYSIDAGEQIYLAREMLAKIFKCDYSNVIFTGGCTESLNLAILGSCKSGGHILTTVYEHNSVLRVLENLKRTKSIEYTIINPNSNGEILANDIQKNIKSNTYMIVVNHTSNVTGKVQNINEIGKIAKKNNLLFLVDAAQSAGHIKIDMRQCNISFLALAGHKGLYGLQGVGALCVGDGVDLRPIKFGGTGTYSESLVQPQDRPEGLESGTQSALNIASLRVGASYAYNNLILINNKILKLSQVLTNNLAKNKYILLYSPKVSESGVVSFNILNKQPQYVASILNDKYGIAVRSGICCAPLVHKFLNTTNGGVVRVSIGINNNMRQIKKFIKAINEICLS